MTTATATAERFVVVVGKESAGKSRLISSLTGHFAEFGNFAGTTVSCERYRHGEVTFVDTPGILRQSDTETTRLALAELATAETIVLVVRATSIHRDLDELLPLVVGKSVIVAVTFWDRIPTSESRSSQLARLRAELGLPVIPVDARKLTAQDRNDLLLAVEQPAELTDSPQLSQVEWLPVRAARPAPSILRKTLSAGLAILALFVPAVLAVWLANGTAALLDPVIAAWRQPVIDRIQSAVGGSGLLHAILIGSYGLVTMGPMLLVWAVPTVLLYAALLGAYKASGLVDWINSALHAVVRPIGLSGRDVVRVVMGFGCNVPAVISTRACSSCSRGTCISAIAFGAACSYQFPATLAVFAAAGQPSLVVPFVGYLLLSTVVYLWVTAPRTATSRLNILVSEPHALMVWPSPATIWAEARGTLSQFFMTALPVFFAITVVASLLDSLGVVAFFSGQFAPLMALFNLPAEAALPVVLASIRKDGILLFTTAGTAGQELVSPMSPVQILTGVYLAGVLLPCLVTAWTIAREQSWRFALRLLARQAAAAILFSLLLAWGGHFVWSLLAGRLS